MTREIICKANYVNLHVRARLKLWCIPPLPRGDVFRPKACEPVTTGGADPAVKEGRVSEHKSASQLSRPRPSWTRGVFCLPTLQAVDVGNHAAVITALSIIKWMNKNVCMAHKSIHKKIAFSQRQIHTLLTWRLSQARIPKAFINKSTQQTLTHHSQEGATVHSS